MSRIHIHPQDMASFAVLRDWVQEEQNRKPLRFSAQEPKNDVSESPAVSLPAKKEKKQFNFRKAFVLSMAGIASVTGVAAFHERFGQPTSQGAVARVYQAMLSPFLPKPVPQRTVYVILSGMNDPTNIGANGLRNGLLGRGVSPENILVLPNPNPSLFTSVLANVSQYIAARNPNSAGSLQEFSVYQQALTNQGVDPVKDRIIIIGHSAGGSRAIALSQNAQRTSRFQPNTVVTLGTPLFDRPDFHPPRAVRTLYYTSEGDLVLQNATGNWGRTRTATGMVATPPAANLDDNDRVLDFPNMGHAQWPQDERVLDSILKEIAEK